MIFEIVMKKTQTKSGASKPEPIVIKVEALDKFEAINKARGKAVGMNLPWLAITSIRAY